jgi:hypothetical protein
MDSYKVIIHTGIGVYTANIEQAQNEQDAAQQALDNLHVHKMFSLVTLDDVWEVTKYTFVPDN